MRKILQLFFALSLMLVLLPRTVQAQDRLLTGTVTTEDNKTALHGVTIRVKGTRKITQTDINGQFKIRVVNADVLEITYVGYQPIEIAVGNGGTITITMKPSDNTMGEVVVTAMDIRKNLRELGYSTQTVKGGDIAQTQRENFLNALQGRVAGLSVTPTTGAAGSSSGIILRGFNSLSGNNQPLFIVDGVILDNQTLNTNSQGGSGIGLASDGNNRNNDFTNRIADLNPSDIESVTVLKGPEATALYGSQANAGAIVISTKKARATSGKILVTYDNNFRAQKITRFARVNNDFGPGASNGIPTALPLLGQFTSFGPAWPALTPLYDNLHHFYQTGFSQTHNLGLEFGTKNVGFRLSGQYFHDQGVVPYNFYTKYNFKFSNNTKIGKFITITPTFSYIYADNVKPLKGTTAIGGYLMDLYEWPANNDIRNYQATNGGKNIVFNANYNTDFDNPIWSAKNNTSGDKTTRYVATLGVDINPFSWLSFAGRFGYDYYHQNGYVFTHPESFVLTAATGGSLDNYYRTYDGYNHTITATAHKNIGKFTTRLMVGTMWQDLETKVVGVYGLHITDSVHNGDLYHGGVVVTSFNPADSNITSVSSRVRLLRNYFLGADGKNLPNLNIFREIAYFAEASVGYKNVAFVTYSQRYEIASPIPKANRKFHYPGASVSVIVSDIIPEMKKGNIVNYMKLRGSLAQTARLNDPYSNQSFFVNNQNSSVIPGFTYGFTNSDEKLRPETQKTHEFGIEARLLKNTINLDASYYNTHCLDQISQGYRASYATGFILNTQNAAELRNQGVEITLGLAPIKKKDFTWNIDLNFDHMWSKVLALPASIGPLNDYYNSDTYISNVRGGLIRGHSTGTITGSIYSRNTAGQIIVSPLTGIPVVLGGNSLIGDRTPKWTLGTLNTFRYKNWSLNFLWDLKVGGDVYNGTDQVLTGLGKSQRTADRLTPIIVPGVLNDGLQNSANPTPNTIVITPYFSSAYYTSMPDEEFIQHNVNWLRLRDITLNFALSQKAAHRIAGLKGMSLFVTGTDLIFFTNYYGADPAINANNPGTRGVGGYGLDLGSAPSPIGVSFGLRANF